MQAIYGPISLVTVTNNLMLRARAAVVQARGVVGLRFCHNTALGGGAGSFYLARADDGTRLVPRDAVIANNVLDRIVFWDRSRARVQTGNAFTRQRTGLRTGDFRAPRPLMSGPFSLPRKGSPLIGRARPGCAAETDLLGRKRPRPATVGAGEPPQAGTASRAPGV